MLLEERACLLTKPVQPENDLEDGECSESYDSSQTARRIVEKLSAFVSGWRNYRPASLGIHKRNTQEMLGDEIEGAGILANFNFRGYRQIRQLEKKRKLTVSLRDIRNGSEELQRLVFWSMQQGICQTFEAI